MPAYRICASLIYGKDYKENLTADCAACGVFGDFAEALVRFSLAVVCGYTVKEEKLRKFLSQKRLPFDEEACSVSLSLLRDDTVVLKNTRRTDGYSSDSTVVDCLHLTGAETAVLEGRGLTPEKDFAGLYFELYSLNDLVYDLYDAMEGAADDVFDDLAALVAEYLAAKSLLTHEVDPAEDGYFCPGVQTKEECFEKWGPVYGFEKDEKTLFCDNLAAYPHGFVVEFRE